MCGSELNVAAFTHPTLNRQPLQAHILVRSSLSDEGRTNANCWAVDLFFAHAAGWERDWAQQDLPDDFHNILAKMGEALHDTVRAPDFAREYGCLPEQLLERVD